jgi:hypothetical protein
MATWLLHDKCFLDCGDGPRLWKAGETVEFDGVPAECMEPKDEAARVKWWAKHEKRVKAGLAPRYIFKKPAPLVSADASAVAVQPVAPPAAGDAQTDDSAAFAAAEVPAAPPAPVEPQVLPVIKRGPGRPRRSE